MKKKSTMQLGMIGLGRMGGNMVRRLIKDGHQCVVYDRSADTVKQLAKEKATGASSLADFVKKLNQPRGLVDGPGGGRGLKPRLIWPAGIRDIPIDFGGNSYYVDDIRSAKELAKRNSLPSTWARAAARPAGTRVA
jgi:6-phosphogluconate dehydrogenase